MIGRTMFNFPTTRLASANWRHPFYEMDILKKEMDRWSDLMNGRRAFGGRNSGVFPALNITEDKDNYYIRAELPGMKPEDIDIQLNGRTITISGELKTEQNEKNIKYHRKERDTGKFSRGVMLTGDINGENVNAKMLNGLLTVSVGKAEIAKSRKININ
ncbi:MAG: Hsp20/alpha crystallin family protein [Desulfamplus sp.]|nr:Hsp20/alpha crystallin family protein [Desulfamplus sp.]